MMGGRRSSQRTLNAACVPVEEHDVDVLVQGPAGGEWLDACCWRCGSTEPITDALGRMLCSPCRAVLSEDRADLPNDPLGVVRGAYWSMHVLERCWRCLTESVDPQDEVGLCPSCHTTLAATDTNRESPMDR
jgi:hypothetical protein